MPENIQLTSTFNNLAGNWLLKRTINQSAHVTGTAKFTSDSEHAHHLLYSEEGELLLDNATQPIHSFNEYIYALVKDELNIFTACGSQPKELLHTLRFTHDNNNDPAIAYGYHLCGSDHYFGKYILDNKTIKIRYEITGPAKIFLIETVLTKIQT